MIKSTASAGVVELQSSPSAYFLWEFPEKPVSVRVSLDVVERLERDILESFRAITSRGSEVGGLLLGRCEAGASLRTVIENYELFHCDYTRGPLYLLSDEEKTRLGDVLRRKKAGQAGAVVGFFRSNTRKDLALDDEDLDIFREYFSRPEQVFLLVKPFAAKPGAAGIFIREDGKVRSEGSYIEFPFRRSELGKGDFAKSIVMDAPRPREAPAEPAAASPSAHKTGSRAPVLPFSLKRDDEPSVAAPPLKKEERAPVVPLTPKVETAVADSPAAPKIVESQAKRAGTKPDTEWPGAGKTVEKAAVAPAPPVEEKREAKREDGNEEKKEAEKKQSAVPAKPAPKEAPVKTVVEEPVLRFDSLPSRSPFGGRKVLALFGGLSLLALGGGTLYYLKVQSAAKSETSAGDASGFQLKAERSNGQLLVSWNRQSDAVKTAQTAVLSITDGPKTEDIPLDLAQLHAGSIKYAPISGEVSFKLEVKSGGKTRTGSVHVGAPDAAAKPTNLNLGGDAAPQQEQTAEQAEAPHQSPRKSTAEAARMDTAKAAGETDERVQQARPVAEAPKPFSLTARVHQPDPTDLPAAPSVNASGNSAGIRPAIPTRLPAPAVPVQAPPTQVQRPAAGSASAAEEIAARTAGKVQQPTLLRRVDAIYPPMAREARVGGAVRLQATLGKDGKVKKLEVLSGAPLLRQAAIDAVQMWVYSPSLLNGKAVESTTDVDVNFNLNTR